MKRNLIFSILSLVVLTVQLHAGDKEKTDAGKYKIPAGFTENKGQVADNKGNFHSEIKFTAQSGATQLYFKTDGVSYVFSDATKNKVSTSETSSVKYYRTDMQLLGSNPGVIIRGENKQGNYKNFYSAANPEGISNVASFGKIIYENIYPKIDLVYTINETGLKYDFIVHPGGNPGDIRMTYVAADTISLDKNKGVLVKNPLGKISDANPVSFLTEDHESVTTSYSQKENVISFVTGNYDQTKTLDIDPFIRLWGTYYGGLNDDMITAMDYTPSTIYANEGIYITGNTNSPSYISTVGAYDAYLSGANDAFLARFDFFGTMTWATYFGGTSDDFALCIDANFDEVVIGGYTSSTNGISGGSPIHQGSKTAGSASTGFLAKFNTNGQRIWSTYYGGEITERVNGIAIDDSNDQIAICGQAQSHTNIATTGRYRTTISSNAQILNGFVAIFNSGGVRQWGSYTYPVLNDVAFMPNHSIAMGGVAYSNFTLAGGVHTVQSVLASSQDAYIGTINSSGSGLIFSTFFGGNGDDNCKAISIDASAGIVATGSTYSTNNVASSGAQQTTNNGSGDAFLVKYTSLFAKEWSTYLGGGGFDWGNSVCQNTNGDIFILGLTSSYNLASANALRTNFLPVVPYGDPVSDLFVAKYDHSGILKHYTYYGTDNNGYEVPGSIATDDLGNLIITGYTFGSDGTGTFNLATSGAYQTNNNAPYSYDGFVGQLWDNEISITGLQNSILCAGQTDIVFYTVAHPFSFINSFTAELSDPNGSFANPIYIGIAYSTVSGSIGVTIPANMPASSLYRIRIHSTYPAQIYSSLSSAFIVRATPAVPVVTATNPVCTGQTINLSTPAVSSIIYHWSGPNNFTSSVQNPSIANAVLADNGTYSLTLTNGNNCISAPGTADLTVFTQPPFESITADGPAKLCEGSPLTLSIAPIQNGLYRWMLNGVDIAGATSSSYSPTVSGVYQVRYSFGVLPCVTYSGNFGVTFYPCRIAQNSSEENADSGLLIYPNPTSGIITVQIPGEGQAEILIYNAMGQLVYDTQKQSGSDAQLDLRQFEDGIYLVKVKTADQVSESKIMLSK